MASGRQNKLAGQIAEHLVCAELGRRDLIATPFAGNVPTFDVIAADDQCRTVPLQIKATRGSSWPTDARLWLDLQFEAATRVQHNGGLRSLSNPELIYVCVALHAPGDGKLDRFFILTKCDLQQVCAGNYSTWMEPRGWRRPKNPESYDCRYYVPQLERFEDNWDIIFARLATAAV